MNMEGDDGMSRIKDLQKQVYKILEKMDDPEKQMEKAIELVKEGTELRTAGYGTTRLYHFSKITSKNSERKIPTRKDLKLRFKLL